MTYEFNHVLYSFSKIMSYYGVKSVEKVLTTPAVTMDEITIAGNHDGLEGNVKLTTNRFNYNSMPSLNDIAIVSIVTAIYKQKDVQEIIQNEEVDVLKKIQQLLHQKLLVLSLPYSLMDKALNFCKLVALQGNYLINSNEILLDYKACSCEFRFNVPLEYFDCICFKMNGTIDKLKTFTLMSESGYPDTFIAACHLCSYELISQIWNKCFSNFSNTSCRLKIYGCLRRMYRFNGCRLSQYWWCVLSKKFPEVRRIFGDKYFGYNIYYYVLPLYSLGVRCSNFNAVKHFSPMLRANRLTASDIEGLIGMAFNEFANSPKEVVDKMEIESLDIAFFLLSKIIDEKQQTRILRHWIRELIYTLVTNLAYQKFLGPVLQLVWNSLHPLDFYIILMISLTETGKGNSVGFKLFMETWNNTSEMIKYAFVETLIVKLANESSFDNFQNSISVQFFEVVKLLLSECSNKEQNKKRKCLYLLFRDPSDSLKEDINNLNALDSFISGLFLSESEITPFKENVFDKYIRGLLPHWIKFDDYNSLDKFLKWKFTSRKEIENYKRSLEFMSMVIDCSEFFINDCEKRDKLTNWYSKSQKEIRKFKRNLAYKVHFRFDDFNSFLKFVSWCFGHNKGDIKKFKKFKSKFVRLKEDMERIKLNDFEYVDKLLNWFLTPEKIRMFKMEHFKPCYDIDIESDYW